MRAVAPGRNRAAANSTDVEGPDNEAIAQGQSASVSTRRKAGFERGMSIAPPGPGALGPLRTVTPELPFSARPRPRYPEPASRPRSRTRAHSVPHASLPTRSARLSPKKRPRLSRAALTGAEGCGGCRCTNAPMLLHCNTMASEGHFNFEGFYRALERRREQDSLSWRQIAHMTGASPSTLSRMSQGARPDLDTVASLAAWAALSLDDFVVRNDAVRRSGIETVVSSLRSDPKLTPQAADALERVMTVAYNQLQEDERL